MSNLQNISVILPSLDPDEKLITVIDGLLSHGFTDIILVNDGSKPENMHYFEEAAQHPEVQLLHHPVNKGKGAALKTAFNYFLEHRPQGIGAVTVDGDNQHHPEDTVRCALNMAQTGHLTLGVRDFSQPHVPPRSRAGNRITSLVFKVFVGMTISDTQTGLRAFTRKNIRSLLLVAGERFEYETNMLLAMKTQGIPFDEVKIRTVYIEENKSSHFRAFRDSWRIYKLIFAHFFKYTLSSLVSAGLDFGLFTLLSALSHAYLSGFALTAAPAAVARLISSLANFFMNKQLVFHAQGKTGMALLRYYTLAIPLAFAQMGLTHGLCLLLGIDPARSLLRGVIYTVVMMVLFVTSYTVQQRWIFSPAKKTK